jgi:hypothetical protein
MAPCTVGETTHSSGCCARVSEGVGRSCALPVDQGRFIIEGHQGLKGFVRSAIIEIEDGPGEGGSELWQGLPQSLGIVLDEEAQSSFELHAIGVVEIVGKLGIEEAGATGETQGVGLHLPDTLLLAFSLFRFIAIGTNAPELAPDVAKHGLQSAVVKLAGQLQMLVDAVIVSDAAVLEGRRQVVVRQVIFGLVEQGCGVRVSQVQEAISGGCRPPCLEVSPRGGHLVF